MKTSRLLLVCLGIALLASCRSSKHAQKQDVIDSVKPVDTEVVTPIAPGNTETTTPVQRQEKKVDAINSKLNLKLGVNNKSIKLTGTYRLKRGNVVQMNLVYNAFVISVSVGTIEITPEGILVVDRINKRYCRASFDEIPQLESFGIDYNTIESIFWGEAENNIPGLQIQYSNWAHLSKGRFPQNIDFTAKIGGNKLNANFEISNINETDKWEQNTQISNKFTEMSLQQALNSIISVANTF